MFFIVIFRFVYTDSTEIDHKNVFRLLYLGTKYDVRGLVEACESYCKSTITFDAVCTLMNLASKYNLSNLWSECIQFIVIHSKRIFPSDYLNKMEFGTVQKFVTCDQLAVEEILIFECLCSWAKQECSRQEFEHTIENERLILGDSLRSIRFPLLKSHIFIERVAATGILTAEEEIDVHRSIGSRQFLSGIFPISERENFQVAFDWEFHKTQQTFRGKTRFTLKSLVLYVSVAETYYIGFTNAKSTDIDYAYEIKCPTEYIEKYIHVYLPNNGIKIERQTNMKFQCARFGNKTVIKGKLENSSILEDIEDDDQLFCKFLFPEPTQAKQTKLVLDDNMMAVKGYFLKRKD